MLDSSVEAGPVEVGSYMVIWEEFGPAKPVEMDSRSMPLFSG